MKNRVTDKKLHDKITQILKDRPDLRDSDSRLITYIWYIEAVWFGHDVKSISALDFLTLLRSDKFSSSESIRRCRQKVQELHPETRGKKYKERHKKQVEVKEFIKQYNII